MGDMKISRETALKFVLLLGVVSLFADMTYEGARSVTGPYLAVFGASAIIVRFVAGFGELIGFRGDYEQASPPYFGSHSNGLDLDVSRSQ